MTPKNSEDADEMPHNAAFHQGLHFLLDKNVLQKKIYTYHLELIICDPTISTMNHPKSIISNQKEESISV